MHTCFSAIKENHDAVSVTQSDIIKDSKYLGETFVGNLKFSNRKKIITTDYSDGRKRGH